MKHKSGFVSIIGYPNAGKSTLVNALIGEKLSIVNAKVQTTRDRIIGIYNSENYQIVFSDTPGIIEPKYKLQKKMMSYVMSSFVDSDLVVYVFDSSSKKNIVGKIKDILLELKVPLLIVINKIDLINQQKVEDIMKSLKSDFLDSDVIPISAKNEFNLEKVLETIKSNLQESPPFYDKTWFTDRSERYLVEEIIRNKILDNFQKEIPYSVNIKVEEFIEDSGLIRIRANIYVLRDSQRAILIGHKGSKLRKIGTQSRFEIEKLFNKKVFLETPIKISKNWRDDEKKLKKFGYQ
ncbi:MAG: GTPase Era [Flavobacteriales bacterium TMED84]|nr:MAG: GTPase Era [Flavobacteriales bacterium TMED84]